MNPFNLSNTWQCFTVSCTSFSYVLLRLRLLSAFARTAPDFWASLEHKIYYKFEGNAPEYISRDLRECAGIVGQLDAKMLSLNEAILEAKEKQEHEREEKIREDEHH